MGFGGKSSTESNTEVYLTFHLKIRASHLNAQTYSQYQQFLYQEITDFRKMGWTFTIISERLKSENIERIGIPEDIRINVTKGMIKYLERHRRSLEKLTN